MGGAGSEWVNAIFALAGKFGSSYGDWGSRF